MGDISRKLIKYGTGHAIGAMRRGPGSILENNPLPNFAPGTSTLSGVAEAATPQSPVNPSESENPQTLTLRPELANTRETITALRERLAKELYRIELDLMGGGRIAGKPCDCLGYKHHFGLEATAEEMMSYDDPSLYNQILQWYNDHKPEFEIEAIANTPPEYYQGLAKEIRGFRKQVMGTADR